MMKIEALVCSQCGAPLDVPEEVEFVTCGQCQTALVVRRNATVHFTEKLEAVGQTTEALADEVASLRYHEELERIDRQWQRQRESLMLSGQYGQKYKPTRAAAVLFMVAIVVFFTIFGAGSYAAGAPPMLPSLGIVMGIAGLVYGAILYDRARRYEQAEAAYRRRRASVRRDDFRVGGIEP